MITYWQWAGVVGPDAIYSRLAERKEKRIGGKKAASSIETDGLSISCGIWRLPLLILATSLLKFPVALFYSGFVSNEAKTGAMKINMSSPLRTLMSCFFVPSPLLRLIEWKVCLPPSALPKPLLCLLAFDEQQVIISVTTMSRWKQSSYCTTRDTRVTCCRRTQKAIQPEAMWNAIFTVLRFNEAELNLPSCFCSSHHRVSGTFCSH